MIHLIIIALVIIYYAVVIAEIGATKYINSPIKTKTDLLWALIPFQIWVKSLIRDIKNLD